MICERHNWVSEKEGCPYCMIEIPAGAERTTDQKLLIKDFAILIADLENRLANLERIILESRNDIAISVKPIEFIKQLRGLNPYSSRNDSECYNKCCDKAEKLLNQIATLKP